MTKDEKHMGLPKAKDDYVDDDGATRVRHLHKKDTKRWCKGREGREHTLEIVYDPQLAFGGRPRKCLNTRSFIPCEHIERCTTCGKVVRRWLPVEECPDAQG